MGDVSLFKAFKKCSFSFISKCINCQKPNGYVEHVIFMVMLSLKLSSLFMRRTCEYREYLDLSMKD